MYKKIERVLSQQLNIVLLFNRKYYFTINDQLFWFMKTDDDYILNKVII